MNFEYFRTKLNIVVGGNSVQDYLIAIVLLPVFYIGFSIIHKVIVYRLEKWAKQTTMDFDDLVVSLLARLGRSFFFALALYFSTASLNLPPTVHMLIRGFLICVLTIRATVLIQEGIRYGIRHTYMKRKNVKNDPTVDSAVDSIISVLRWIIWLGAVLFLLDNLGVNITTMVASIGITGIAVGMASQAILGDMFSAFAIFLDKPFEVGDFVIVDNFMGTVEHIGIKTTRIRSLSGEQLIFANSDLTKSRIKNYKLLQQARGATTLTLAFNTPVSKLREAREVMLKTIEGIPEVRVDHVHLMSFGTSGYNYELAFYVIKEHVGQNFDVQQDVFFKVAECLEKIGIIPVAQAQDIIIKELPKLGETLLPPKS